MVAVIKSSHSIHRILNYNENKVKDGVAECIGEGNYPVDADQMTFNIKLNYLLRQLRLNENVTANSVHISLNFDPSESHLENQKMMAIADDYMKQIGFEKQPYLVYRHYDAGHPHIHIVSIKVRGDGSRIDMHNIGRNQSETARKDIEKRFGLVEADGRKSEQNYELKPIPMRKIQYGKIQSKKAINNVLNVVLPMYKYGSLTELNAVLNQYNVHADRGNEDSRIFKAGGLVYRILDELGKPTGVPIKASDFYNRPTLKYLEEKFSDNRTNRNAFKSRVKNLIDKSLIGEKITIEKLREVLQKDGLAIVMRRNDQGNIYGITYVDHHNKCVFNGSTLGKLYTAKGIIERCLPEENKEQHLSMHAAPWQTGLQPPSAKQVAETDEYNNDGKSSNESNSGSIIDELMQVENGSGDFLSGELKGKKKRKKRKNLRNRK